MRADPGSKGWGTADADFGQVVLPADALIHRISVEEAVLTEVMGPPYANYATHTKRLVPRLW